MQLPKDFPLQKTLYVQDIPHSAHSFFIRQLVENHARPIVFFADDLSAAQSIQSILSELVTDRHILLFPEWDTVPYDRLSPASDRMGKRMAILSDLLSGDDRFILILPVWAAFQKVLPKNVLTARSFHLSVGSMIQHDDLISFLSANGYHRVTEVMETGEFSVRGSLIDLFPSGAERPVRLDFFDTELETIKPFHPLTQRTDGTLSSFSLYPVNEVILTDDTIATFRQNYRDHLPESYDLLKDELYQAISAKQMVQGVENYLPFFYNTLSTLFDYLPQNTLLIQPHQFNFIADQFQANLKDYFDYRVNDSTRLTSAFSPEKMYLTTKEVSEYFKQFSTLSFMNPIHDEVIHSTNFNSITHLKLAKAKQELLPQIKQLMKGKRRVIFVGDNKAFIDRVSHFLDTHLPVHETLSEAFNAGYNCILIHPFSHGFSTDTFSVITEADLFDTTSKSKRHAFTKKHKKAQFIEDCSTLEIGDYIVHIEHGIGRYEGLHTLTISNQPHDFLKLSYGGGGSLFVPVEQMDVLSKYGHEKEGVMLDKLGSTAWQERKARVKRKLKMMAEKLIKTAAKRLLADAPVLPNSSEIDYDKFVDAFPYVETDDQLNAVDEIMTDFQIGRPMDRLLCADVGYGKTEVAWRAAFFALSHGHQVALVAPTTLLTEQHYANALQRFKDFPFRIAKLSRAVSAKQATQVKADLEAGKIDLVIGTHSLFANSVTFKDLGLLIVDEEQSFGVAHKEKIKQTYPNAHQLTLTATPIPRTLQLSLSGVRELSVMTTAPAARLPVLTHLTPFNPLAIKDAILRERARNGQVFVVCPRIKDLHSVHKELLSVLPDLKVTIGHGQMGMRALEQAMDEFANGETDVLLSTTIIESGLDLPNVNTMIIYRADRFGLAALYQLRGRIGRRQRQAYCYLTYPSHMKLSDTSKKRLEVIHTLSGLGAGFQLASYDLDIRGAGNLLGAEQSGHIKEVGIELYQKMLEEMIKSMKQTLLAEAGKVATTAEDDEQFVPKITAPLPMIIPNTYINSADLRLELYQRLAHLRDTASFDDFEAELSDRFGVLPVEVRNLITMARFKESLYRLRISEVDLSTTALTIRFYQDKAPAAEKLLDFILRSAGVYRILPDHRVMYSKVQKKTAFDAIKTVIDDLSSILL